VINQLVNVGTGEEVCRVGSLNLWSVEEVGTVVRYSVHTIVSPDSLHKPITSVADPDL
jgi:hypothetical protein